VGLQSCRSEYHIVGDPLDSSQSLACVAHIAFALSPGAVQQQIRAVFAPPAASHVVDALAALHVPLTFVVV
tara:strand:- start:288 stop:500 length:213 start_codon:yes stop_codon:yes gene_type:complete